MVCQFYSMPIKIPVRGAQCTTHYTPMDLTNFIMSSMRASKSAQSWKCPICKRRAYDLFIDEYLLGLVKSNKDINELRFDSEGNLIEYLREK